MSEKLNCKVGEIWLNSNEQEREIIAATDEYIVAKNENMEYVYYNSGKQILPYTVNHLVKKRPNKQTFKFATYLVVYKNSEGKWCGSCGRYENKYEAEKAWKDVDKNIYKIIKVENEVEVELDE